MSTIKFAGAAYDVRDRECIGRLCLQLGRYQHRGAIGASGSRNTGAVTPCCVFRAYHGCPSAEKFPFDPVLARDRKRAGYKK
jgi:hypothetical protein